MNTTNKEIKEKEERLLSFKQEVEGLRNISDAEEYAKQLAHLFLGNGLSLQTILLMAIDFGQQHPNWISVKDELPPIDEDYVKQGFAKPDEEGNTLTVSTTVLVTDGKYVETTFYMFELKRWNSQMDDTKITHWMPLPQPPRKEVTDD